MSANWKTKTHKIHLTAERNFLRPGFFCIRRFAGVPGAAVRWKKYNREKEKNNFFAGK
jgi:hypothetical protein